MMTGRPKNLLPPCRICGALELSIYARELYAWRGEVYHLLKCRRCAVVQLDRLPLAEDIRAWYNEDYFREDYSLGLFQGDYLSAMAARRPAYEAVLDEIADYHTQGELLEVGCAAGGILPAARARGFRVTGVDLSPWAVQTASKEFGLHVYEGALTSVNLPAARFQVIYLGDTLEHLPDPAATLKEAARILTRDGILALKVPIYINSPWFAALRVLTRPWRKSKKPPRLLRLMKLNTSIPYAPYHLFEFSPRSLGNLLSQTAFLTVTRRYLLTTPELLLTESGIGKRLLAKAFAAGQFASRRVNLPLGHILILARPS